MSKKQRTKNFKKRLQTKWVGRVLLDVWSFFRFVLVLPDTVLFAYYAAYPKAIKQIKIQTHQKFGKKWSPRHDTLRLRDVNMNKVLKEVSAQVDVHMDQTPLWLALSPTAVLTTLIWFALV